MGCYIHQFDRKLTAILKTYNQEDTVEAAVESMLNQNTNFDYTIMILDDCSTDKTSAICSDYAKKHPEKIVHICQKKNLGVTSNYRDGLNRIRSSFIAVLEGDDLWTDANKLQLQVDAMEENPECLIGGHDTLVVNLNTGRRSLFIGGRADTEKQIIFSGPPGPFRMHPSSRIYRNHDCLRNLPKNLLFDTHLYRHFMMLGKGIYLNRNMSTHHITGQGFWSGRKKIDRKIFSINLAYEACRYYNFEQDRLICKSKNFLGLLKSMFGPAIGWKVYHSTYLFYLKLRKIFSHK
ncbi:MAG: glycosyltransferase family 2 protein [Verrucomicrobiae bacterium]|nr:glycosyltransferase family 2 protein [Verrucomicrobiae bacterium]NNJ43709.1 glycosyltransferase family 2 protein [Akkermansiaceae bacterium]